MNNKPWAGVCRLGAVGDNLIAASVLPLLHRTHNVEFIAQAPQSCILENNPYIDKLTVKQPHELPPESGDWHKWFNDRAKEYDKFFNLSHSCESLLVLFAGQSQFYWPAEWRRKWCDHSYIEMVHDIVGVPHDFGPLFFPTEEEQTKAKLTRSKLRPRVVGWCLSGTRIDKVYPYAGIAISRLIRELEVSVIMFGAGAFNFEMSKNIMQQVERQNGSLAGLHQAVSPEINESGEEAADASGSPTAGTGWRANAPGEPVSLTPPVAPLWPIRRTLAQLLACDLVIGPDTGPLWATAFEPMPKIMLLSHATPRNITSHWKNTITLHADPKRVDCWACHKLHDTIETCRPNSDKSGVACISDISVEEIVQNARQLLDDQISWEADKTQQPEFKRWPNVTAAEL